MKEKELPKWAILELDEIRQRLPKVVSTDKDHGAEFGQAVRKVSSDLAFLRKKILRWRELHRQTGQKS